VATDPLEFDGDERDVRADERDRRADERDRRADARDEEGDERDRAAQAAEHHANGDIIDLREQRTRTLLEEQATADRTQAGLDRASSAADRHDATLDRRAAAHERRAVQGDETAAVAAHTLLNSSAVISMGIETLQGHWEAMPGADRVSLLQRMLAQASSLDDRLRDLIQGRLSLALSKRSEEGL
jgi:hypothetical protein